MSRRRTNQLVSQIKDQFVNAPPEIRLDFLRKNDEAFETESNDLINMLTSFRQEFGQITSVFDANGGRATTTNTNAGSLMGTLAEGLENSESGTEDLEAMLKGMINKHLTTKVIVNPEITQKVQAAESAAVAKYLEQLDYQKRFTEENAALKTYARQAQPSTAKGSAALRAPLSAATRMRFADPSASSEAIGLDEDEEIAAELKEMHEEIMDRLQNQDRLIESGRERLAKRLQERRMAAMAAKKDSERNRAEAILSKQDEVENNFDKTKMDMQRKLMSRIEEQVKNRPETPQAIE